jgi:hypothetical protein
MYVSLVIGGNGNIKMVKKKKCRMLKQEKHNCSHLIVKKKHDNTVKTGIIPTIQAHYLGNVNIPQTIKSTQQ